VSAEAISSDTPCSAAWAEGSTGHIDLTDSPISLHTVECIKKLLKLYAKQPTEALKTIIAQSTKPVAIWELIVAFDFLMAEEWLDAAITVSLYPSFCATFLSRRPEVADVAVFGEEGETIIQKEFYKKILMPHWEILAQIEHTEAPDIMSSSPNGMLLATTTTPNIATIWNVRTGTPCAQLEGHTNTITGLAWLPDSHHIVSASHDKTIRLWNAATGTCCQIITHTEPINSLQIITQHITDASGAELGHAPLIVTTDLEKTLKLWDLTTASCCATFSNEHIHYNVSISCAPHINELVVAIVRKNSPSLTIWHPTRNIEHRPTYHKDTITALAWSPDGSCLATGSRDCTVRIWSTNAEKLIKTLEHKNEVNALAWRPHGSYLAVACDDGVYRWLINPRINSSPTRLGEHLKPVISVAWHPDSSYFVSADTAGTTCVWHNFTSRCCTTIETPTTWHLGTRWTEDGRHLVTQNAKGTIAIIGNTDELEKSSSMAKLYLLACRETCAAKSKGYTKLPESTKKFFAEQLRSPKRTLLPRAAAEPSTKLDKSARYVYVFLREKMHQKLPADADEIATILAHAKKYRTALQKGLSEEEFTELTDWLEAIRRQPRASSSRADAMRDDQDEEKDDDGHDGQSSQSENL
jgi:WD40 repeat protein